MTTPAPISSDRPMEFASPEWFDFLAKLLVARGIIDPEAAAGATCEVYRKVPAHLARDESRELAWTRRVADGRVTVTFEECSDEEAAVKLVGDYDALRPLSVFIVTEENADVFGALMEEAIRSGRIEIVKARPVSDRKPDHTVHNLVGAVTR